MRVGRNGRCLVAFLLAAATAGCGSEGSVTKRDEATYATVRKRTAEILRSRERSSAEPEAVSILKAHSEALEEIGCDLSEFHRVAIAVEAAHPSARSQQVEAIERGITGLPGVPQ